MTNLQRKKQWNNLKNYRIRKFLATNLTPQAFDHEDEQQSNLSSTLYLAFIFKPENKINDVTFEMIFSVLKKPKLKM